MNQIHRKLMKQKGWYHFWHTQKRAHAAHWTALLVAVFFIGALVLIRINDETILSGLHGVSTEAATITPELPRTFLTTSVASTPVTGQTINVPAGGNFQTALDNAQLGDEIVLAAGATYTGNFILPNKTTGSGWITIRTSNMAGIPREGQRISPRHAAAMPKIMTNNVMPAIHTDGYAAHHFRFIGVEIGVTSALTLGTIQYGIVNLGPSDGNGRFEIPSDIIFDRTYIHGHPTCHCKRGLDFNGRRLAIVDSYVSDIHGVGQDTQAINAILGGPFKIVNNYLEAAGENVMFGGATVCQAYNPNYCPFGASPYVGDIPSDIEIRYNYFFKPLSWRAEDPSYAGIPWSVKNQFEIKSARRVLMDGNILQNNWVKSQVGFAILFNCVDDSGPWSRIEDITLSNNIIRHSASGFNIKGREPGFCQASRILLKNNLFDDISAANWAGDGRLYQIYGGVQGITVDHNTAIHDGHIITTDYDTALSNNFSFTNNLSKHNLYGVFGSGGFIGTKALNHYFTNWTFSRNGLAELQNGITELDYPAGNFFPTSFTDQFVDARNGNFALTANSPLKGQATDGSDIGVNMTSLNAATAGVITGKGGNVSPPPDTTSPTVSMTIPAHGATIFGTNTPISATASDNIGVIGVQFKLNNSNLGAEDTASPYSISWDSTTVANGNYTLTAVARDAAGNTRVASAVTVTVSNAPVIPNLIVDPAVLSFNAVSGGSTPVAKTVNLTTSAGSSVWSASTNQPWCHVSPISGSAESSAATMLAVSVDSPSNIGAFSCLVSIIDPNAGNSPQNVTVTYTVTSTAPPSDTTPPTVTITKPTAGSTIPRTGQLKISVTANDASGIASIKISFDGVALKTCNFATTCNLNIPVQLIKRGNHTITAQATDDSAKHNSSNVASTVRKQ
jgi:hypothetical protein